MSNIQENHTDIRKEMLFTHKKNVLRLYKEGYGLGEICRLECLDISTILYILRKCKVKKNSLYKIYQNQTEKSELKKPALILENEKIYLEKFFPSSDSSNFSSSYYWFWKENYNKDQEKKDKCSHYIKHIRCSICNKILKDATNIKISDEIIITHDKNKFFNRNK